MLTTVHDWANKQLSLKDGLDNKSYGETTLMRENRVR